MTIANIINSVIDTLPATPVSKAGVVGDVMKAHPHLNSKSVARIFDKMRAENKFKYPFTRNADGTFTFATPKSSPAKPKRPTRSLKTAAAKAAEAVSPTAHIPDPRDIQPATRVGKTFVGLVTDNSGSMSSYQSAALKDFNSTIDALIDGSKVSETSVTVVQCGANYGRLAHVVVLPTTNLQSVKLPKYDASGCRTPLWDAVGLLVETMRAKIKLAAGDAGLIQVTTDGYDNSSRKYNGVKIADLIKELQATDQWTFTFRVPDDDSKKTLIRYGIPADNIQVWTTTTKGLSEASADNVTAVARYYQARSTGKTKTQVFYTNVDSIAEKTLQRTLVDVSDKVKLLTVTPGCNNVVASFIKDALGVVLKKGSLFYQLMKTETLQEYKQVLIRDKATGAMYSGAAARDLLGLPHTGTIKIKPGNHGNFDIYMQSTSVNRVLPVGTLVAYWDEIGTSF